MEYPAHPSKTQKIEIKHKKKDKLIEITNKTVATEYVNDVEVDGIIKNIENTIVSYQDSIKELEDRLATLTKIKEKVKFD